MYNSSLYFLVLLSLRHSSVVRTLISVQQTFLALRPIYGWRMQTYLEVVTLWVNCPLWVRQPDQLSLPVMVRKWEVIHLFTRTTGADYWKCKLGLYGCRPKSVTAGMAERAVFGTYLSELLPSPIHIISTTQAVPWHNANGCHWWRSRPGRWRPLRWETPNDESNRTCAALCHSDQTRPHASPNSRHTQEGTCQLLWSHHISFLFSHKGETVNFRHFVKNSLSKKVRKTLYMVKIGAQLWLGH